MYTPSNPSLEKSEPFWFGGKSRVCLNFLPNPAGRTGQGAANFSYQWEALNIVKRNINYDYTIP
jgi:hypothetical protein